MVENNPSNRIPLGGGPDAVGGVPTPAQPKVSSGGGAEFQALLDKIEERARDLAEQSRAVERPEELAGAVDSARESLEDVLSLKDRLLEAYEQARHQDPPTGATP